MQDESQLSFLGALVQGLWGVISNIADNLGALAQGLWWVISNIAMAVYNLGYAVTHPGLWLDWSNKESLLRFVYYGASTELFFVLFAVFLGFLAFGLYRRNFLWGVVRVLEGISNTVGRVAAWAGLIMVLQQVLIVFVQRIFALPTISIGFGSVFVKDISWWSEELKLFNATVVALCVSYAFVQGSHVRVDLIYGGISYRAKKVVDMLGSLLFMVPMAVLTWLYAWFFLWRSLITPKLSASNTLELMLKKARIVKWNVETIGFSPNGFNAYFLFKILMCAFILLVFIQAFAFFYRSLLEFIEGEEAEGRYLPKDTLGEGEEAYEGTH